MTQSLKDSPKGTFEGTKYPISCPIGGHSSQPVIRKIKLLKENINNKVRRGLLVKFIVVFQGVDPNIFLCARQFGHQTAQEKPAPRYLVIRLERLKVAT